MTGLSDSPPDGLVRAQRIAIGVAEEVSSRLVAGQTEREVQAIVDRTVLAHGASGVWTPTVIGFGAGTLSCFPTDVPTERPLWGLDVAMIDVHPTTVDGWWGDCTRTVVLGGNIPQTRALETVERIHAHLLAVAQPGMRACDWFGEFSAQLEGSGYVLLDRLQNIGHSLGRDTSYDDGYIDVFNETPMTGAWAVEPFIGNHLYGVKREDVVWFGPTRCTVIA